MAISSFFVFLLFNIVERQYKRNGKDMDENNVPEIRPTFEEVRKVDDNGKEYWSSHELFNAMILLILKASNIYKNEI